MRKRMKKKARSCRMCKPHKMGLENRWNQKERVRLTESEKEIAEAYRT